MKKKKLLLLALIPLIILIVVLFVFVFKNRKEVTLGAGYLPLQDEIYLDNGELSYVVNPLVYPSSITLTEDGYDEVLAKSVKIKENVITVNYKQKIAETVYNSYMKILREPYENNWKCSNIVGVKEYQEYTEEIISGIGVIDENTLMFTVTNPNDLEFLTMPIVIGDLGEYKIVEYKDYEYMILENDAKQKIKIKKASSDDKNFDAYISGNADIPAFEGYKTKEIYPFFDYIALLNYNKEEIKILKNIINGKIENKVPFTDIMFWCDASPRGYYITEDLKEKFTNNNIEFKLDFGESWFLLEQISKTNKCMFYYEDNYFDKDLLKSENVELIKTKSKTIYIYYKDDKVIDRFF